jgi:ketosteroid isomerase-like protein
MSMFLKSLALCSAGLLMAASTAVAQQTAPARDVTQAVSALHREWILVGWEKKEGDGPFDFRSKLGRFYELGARDLMLYDDFEPQRRVARSADQYGGFWTGPFTSLKSAKHAVVDAPSTLVSGDLASSTLEFTARLEAPDGKITAIRTRSSLTWRLSDAQWKIVREHNSSTVIDERQLEALIAAADRPFAY